MTIHRTSQEIREAFATTTGLFWAALRLGCSPGAARRLRALEGIAAGAVGRKVTLTARDHQAVRDAFEVDQGGRATVPARVAAKRLGASIQTATRRGHLAGVEVWRRGQSSMRRSPEAVRELYARKPRPSIRELQDTWGVTSRQAVYNILDAAGIERRKMKKDEKRLDTVRRS